MLLALGPALLNRPLLLPGGEARPQLHANLLWKLPILLTERLQPNLFQASESREGQRRMSQFLWLLLIDAPEAFRIGWIVAQDPGEVVVIQPVQFGDDGI